MKTTIFHILIGLICFCHPSQSTGFSISLSPSYHHCTYRRGKLYVLRQGRHDVGGTNAGVKSYDGYQVRTYKTNAYQPGILPNNTIRSIAEDHQDNLWLGTRNGLVRMNKRTGKFKTFFLPDESQRIIYTLFVSKDGTLWIGTDGGTLLLQFQDRDVLYL